AAALSQIPAENLTGPTALTLGTKVTNNPTKDSLAMALAERIVQKRPFLCRMDFEDFLAAQIGGCSGAPDDLTSTGTPDVIPTDALPTPDPMWTDATDSKWSDFGPAPGSEAISWLIYLGIGRRFGAGN